MAEDTLALIERAHQGDKAARECLFEANTGLIYSVIRRFAGRGADMEDLFQIGSIGLLKAVDKFDTTYEVKFSTYAVPMIVGEIRRFLRDDGILKVSRSIKENQCRVYRMREKLEGKLGREPGIKELAQALEMSVEELGMILESVAEVESIYRTIHQGEGTELRLLDKLPETENGQEKVIDQIFLKELLDTLDPEERKLICLRYFRDMTQTEVALRLGISQVQVSRIEKRILNRLRNSIRT